MEAQPILHPSLPLSNPSSSFPMSMPPQMTHKQVAPSPSQALPATTPTHPSSSGATVNSKVFGSLLSSADGTYVPPGVSTLSTLNSLALSLAMRIAPVTVAHSAPHTAHFSEAGSYHPGAPAAAAAPSTPVMHIHLDPDHMFPLSAPLHIPHHKRPGHPRLSGTPSQAQIFGLVEEEAAEVQGKWWHSTASGVIGGICCVYAGQPFDTVKVRLQTQSTVHRLYQSPLDCLRKTISQGGYRALYKGSSAALASVVLENAVLFTANAHVKETMKRLSANPEADLSLGQEALAGGIAGIFSSTAITPAEVIKCRLQIQDRLASGTIANAPMRYTGPVDAVIKTVRGEGLQGLFKGLPSLWMRDIPFNFVFLGSYEAFCHLSSRTLGKSREELGPAELFFCGGMAGVSGWSIIFPMDVVKSKVQTNAFPGASNLEVIRQTFRAGGIRAFYQGWSAAVMRAFPANAALLLGVEFSKRLFEEYS